MVKLLDDVRKEAAYLYSSENARDRCYCQMYQLSKEQVKTAYDNAEGFDVGQLSRKVAEKQIKLGIMNI